MKGKVGKNLAQVLSESNVPHIAETCEYLETHIARGKTTKAPNHLAVFSPNRVLPPLSTSSFNTATFASPHALAGPIVSPQTGHDTHVVLPPNVFAQLPELDWNDRYLLEEIAENPTAGRSRMASQVTLGKELDGMVVAVKGNRPINMN